MKNYPSLRFFFSYIGTFRRTFWLTVLMFTVSNVILAAIPWLIGQFTESLIQDDGNIVVWTAALIACSVGHDATWRSAEYMYLKLILKRSHSFDDVVFCAVMNHSYGYFVNKFTGKVSSYANTLGREFRSLLGEFCYEYVALLIAMPFIAATMFTVNLYTGVVFVISILLMYIFGRKLALGAAAAERTEADERSTMDGFVVDAIANFVSVKAFGNEVHEADRLSQKRSSLIKAATHSQFKNIIFWGVMSLFVRWIIWPATFILNVYLFSRGEIDLAQMVTFLAAIVLFSNYIWGVIWNISQLNIKIAGVEEAYQYLFGTQNILDKPSGRPAPSASNFLGSLELKEVTFAYPDKPEVPVLKNINMVIKQGEKIGIIGPSGGGKSTMVKLLLGYYPLPDGTLILDGKRASKQTLTDLIAYVPQDTAIFHRSIRENIAYGRPGATDNEIKAAARHAQAHEFIMALESGYDTYVGERGIKLSGGQRQRIAIARALLKNAPLLLLDEATSALDSQSEKQIQAAFDKLLIGHTAIVIAHRLSTIQKMDRIIVIDHGSVVEQGSHDALLARKGLYAKLWGHQSGGFIKE